MINSSDTPEKVSCLIVTADRKNLLQRSLYSYKNQTHSNKELVIIDNGREPIEELLSDFEKSEVCYVRVKPSEDNVLGNLRNLSLEHATGNYITCWDDDDWFHPERIEIQLSFIKKGYDACCLTGNLFHIDTDTFWEHPYRGSLPDGSPSTILHRKNEDIRYPSLPREEDTVYLNEWMNHRYKALPMDYTYLFVRCFHGTNVSGKKHFLRRLKNSPVNWLRYQWHAKVKGNLFEHPKFKLTEKEKESFTLFLEDSRKFDLI